MFLSASLAQRPREGGELTFDIQHRVNAHGDEFNTLAKSSDGKRLFTGTEKSEIIVWDIAANRLERTLRQTSAVHLVASLADPREFVALGWNHFKPINALARKWNVETGEFVDLPGLDSAATPVALATETTTNLIAATTTDGKLSVWDARTNKQLGEWKVNGVPIAVALLGREAYVATVDEGILRAAKIRDSAIVKVNVDNPQQAPADFLRMADRVWMKLAASPDYRLLSANYQLSSETSKTVVIDPGSKREIGSFDFEYAFWLDADKLMLFEWLDPTEIVQVSANEPARSIRKFERFESDTRGRAFDLTGQVSAADGSKVWASYSKGPGLLEFDLAAKKIKTLIEGPSGAYALSVLTEDGQTGEVLTGGGDGYVRLWKLADLSLIKEYKVATAEHFVSDALLVPGSRRAVVGIVRMDSKRASFDEQMPMAVILLDLETGQQKKLFDVFGWRTRLALINNQIVFSELGRIKFATLDGVKTKREFFLNSAIMQTAVSANNRWLAVIDYSKKLHVFNLATGRKRTITIKDEIGGGPAVITNDGRFVYRAISEGMLRTWDMVTAKTTTNPLSEMRNVHTRVDFLSLTNDDRWLVAAGNHSDVGIFERTTLRTLLYVQNSAAAFYVEKVWVKGNRMIMTGDSGVMHSGVLK